MSIAKKNFNNVQKQVNALLRNVNKVTDNSNVRQSYNTF